jgi:hypothetical protein
MPSSPSWTEHAGQELQRTAKDLCQVAHELVMRAQPAINAVQETQRQSATLRDQVRQRQSHNQQQNTP